MIRYKLVLDEDACSVCGDCADACETTALQIEDDVLVFNGLVCTFCESCYGVCPEDALRIEYTIEEEGVI